ncbi:hypothetical protein BJY24_006449 [Nocardia transvalensis]|uniref:Subtilisin inhibitor domain-containing protein n=1 Tax=Nocardia transvalensis TaxID=37333 RepID=A0A7W9ULN2_9NOCA|nr:SSI family serine proteinase inhibitor [Nocardia transvalensis]MBB5917537.1 hypothetical protein [Nocardia transvalensis]
MRVSFRTLLTASGVLLASAALAVPAGADPGPDTQLTLSVARGEGGAPAVREVTLTCDPSGGSHPDADAACQELAATDGDLDALATQDSHTMCTMIWDPVTVTATGARHGRPVEYQHTFASSCVQEGAGAVFRF